LGGKKNGLRVEGDNGKSGEGVRLNPAGAGARGLETFATMIGGQRGFAKKQKQNKGLLRDKKVKWTKRGVDLTRKADAALVLRNNSDTGDQKITYWERKGKGSLIESENRSGTQE